MRRLTLVVCCLLFSALRAHAEVPRLLSFQGQLEDPAGVPMTGSTSLTFDLYDVAEDGTPLHTETDVVSFDSRGVFVTTLGDSPAPPLDPEIFDQELWIGITPEGGSELGPRVPFRAAPYALRAALADEVDAASAVAMAVASNTAALSSRARLDEIMMAAVEGSLFINPGGLTGNTGTVNGKVVHLCSAINNPGFNDGQRVSVRLRNRNVASLAGGTPIDEIDETNIRVYAYDSFFPETSGSSFGLVVSSTETDLADFLDHAEVVVTHTDGAALSISIEAIAVRHKLTLADLPAFAAGILFDFRSAESRQFCVHQDLPFQ